MAAAAKKYLDQSFVEELEEENKALSNQVKKLIQVETQLFDLREERDIQMSIYRSLNETNIKLNSAKNIKDICEGILDFIESSLNYQNAYIFKYREQTDAYHYIDHTAHTKHDPVAISQIGIPKELPLLEELIDCKRRYLYIKNRDSDLAKTLNIDKFFIYSLKSEEYQFPHFLVIAGNNQNKSEVFSPILESNLYHLGLENLISQSHAALKNVLNSMALEQKVQERTKQLSRAMDEMIKVDELKNQFFANISHEIRTPLTLSLGPIKALFEEKDVNSKDYFYLDIVQKNLLRLSKLINEILDFSKIESGKMDYVFQKIDIVKLTKYCHSILKGAAHNKNIELTFSTNSDKCEIYIDQQKIEKVIINLLSNAYKFTDSGGKIKINLTEERDTVKVSISDTGIGIPEDLHIKIFDRFSQVDSSSTRKYSGTGIGLAMVKEYILIHNGEISLESTPKHGSNFTITLNKGWEHLDKQHIQQDTTAREEFHIDDSLLSDFNVTKSFNNFEEIKLESQDVVGPEFKVLLVEDNDDMINYMKVCLHNHFEILLAHDGEEGIKKAKKEKPDLIITDAMMPNKSGYDLCKELKNDNSPIRSTPIIMLTARSEPDMKLKGLRYGADDYLVKPFNPQELIVRSSNLLKVRKYQHELELMNQDLLDANSKIKHQQRLLISQEKFDTLGQITASVSHEISTPLLSIQAIAEWISNYIKDLEKFTDQEESLERKRNKVQRKFDILEESIERIRHHINQMKSFIRFQDSKETEFNINKEIETTLNILSYKRPPHIEIQTNLDPNLQNIFGNPAEINQLLSNVISNGMDAIPKSEKGLITIQTKNLGERVLVSIEDNGQGMSDEIKNSLFQTIRTTKGPDTGTGVGLYLCRQIIEDHDIDYKITSQINKGTKFEFIFSASTNKANQLGQK